MTRKSIVSVYLPPKLVKVIDGKKENYSRSSYIQNLLTKILLPEEIKI